MRALLDTHVLLWAASASSKLSRRARSIIESPRNEIMVSAASAWEIATKHRLGRLPVATALVDDFVLRVTDAGYLLLSISVEHALRAGRLPASHSDPFDRILAAQALHEDLALISADEQMDIFGVRREW